MMDNLVLQSSATYSKLPGFTCLIQTGDCTTWTGENQVIWKIQHWN